jgi:hypothetical protein
MDQLPFDVIQYVLWSFLTPVDRINLKLTSQKYYSLRTNIKLASPLYSRLCIEYGYLGLLKELNKLKNHEILFQGICLISAGHGHLNILKWAQENGYVVNKRVCAYAALDGHLEILKWLRDSGYAWDEFICPRAASRGHLHVLKWARENGCLWGDTCFQAAQAGKLDILKWARENGCPWNAGVCSCATQAGHLEILKWARANGCPWDKNYCIKISIFSNSPEHKAILDWIQSL